MKNFDEKEILELWDNRAKDWDIQVGDDGDSNRILNSDPVLWSFAGNVAGLSVLDAGCGTGYLSRQLCLKGASVTCNCYRFLTSDDRNCPIQSQPK